MDETARPSAPPPPASGGGSQFFSDLMAQIDVQDITARISEMLSAPNAAWARIKSDTFTVEQLYKKFVIPMVVASALCNFIGGAILGPATFGGGISLIFIQVLGGLVSPFIGYFLLSFLVPNFGGSASKGDIFKFLVFPMLVSSAASMFSIIPDLSILSIVRALISLAGGVYALYLLWLGVPIMLGVSDERRPGLFIALVGLVIVCLTVFVWMASVLML